MSDIKKEPEDSEGGSMVLRIARLPLPEPPVAVASTSSYEEPTAASSSGSREPLALLQALTSRHPAMPQPPTPATEPTTVEMFPPTKIADAGRELRALSKMSGSLTPKLFVNVLSKMKLNKALMAVMVYYTVHQIKTLSKCITCFDQDTLCSTECERFMMTRAKELLIETIPESWMYCEHVMRAAGAYFMNVGQGKFHPKYARAYVSFQDFLHKPQDSSPHLYQEVF